MKKILKHLFLVICFLFTVQTSFAQVQKYKTNEYAFATIDGYGKYHWDNWQKTGTIYIYFNLTSDVITITSNKTQTYYVYETSEPYTDNSGGTQVKFSVIDGEFDKGEVRLRIQRDGSSQIYVDFADVAWVYGNVIRVY